MAKRYEEIDESLAEFMAAQPVFFVASAPSGPGGHVNCSPKGNSGAFVVLGPTSVAYQDLTGSGAETVAHLRENGRIVVMFCAFSGPPKIVRLHGRGTLVLPGEERFEELAPLFAYDAGRRAFVDVEVHRVSTSCGFGAPLMSFQGHRGTLTKWAEAKGPEKLEEYREEKNSLSLDGLPALPVVPRPGDGVPTGR